MKIRKNTDNYNIGKIIRKYRMQNHLTQEQTIAKMNLLGVDISRGTYSHIECGSANIEVVALLALAEIFHTPISSFFDEFSLPIRDDS